MRMKFGSKLYGTDTPLSDTDFKGIYLPTIDEYLLQNVKKCHDKTTGTGKQKNTADDIDSQIFSLNYFLELCKNGDTYAIDCLHCPGGWEDITSDIWEDLKSKRHLFYTKNLKSYLSYCRHQAAKYGLRGGRINSAQQMIDWCKSIVGDGKKDKHRIFEYVEKLPKIEYVEKKPEYKQIGESVVLDMQTSYIDILGKKYIYHDYVENMLQSLEKFIEQYGERARLASINEGVDYKAIHHAFRAGLQLKEIFETGDLKYPLKDREFLLKVKKGEMNYSEDNLGGMLEELIDEVKTLSDKSNFPEKCNNEYWNEWLIQHLKNNII